jgi:hypothetical protein
MSYNWGRTEHNMTEPYAWVDIDSNLWNHRTSLRDIPLYTKPQGDCCGETCKRAKLCYACSKELGALTRGDVLRCIETDELCTVETTSTSGKTLVKWASNDFAEYTAEQIGELFWVEPKPLWQGLTDEEIHDCFQNRGRDRDGLKTRKLIAAAIEAMLREKNT